MMNAERTKSGYIDTSSDDEEKPMIIREGISNFDDENNKESTLIEGVLNLHYVVVTSAWALSIAMLTFVFCLFDPTSLYSSYSWEFDIIFSVLWIGHLLIYLLMSRIFRSVYNVLVSKKQSGRAELWLDTNEKWIPLIVFIGVQCGHITYNSTFLLLSEIFLFFYINNGLSLVYFLVPLYLMVGSALLNIVLCRSKGNTIKALTSLTMLAFLIMFTLKTVTSYGTQLTWYLTLIPVYALLAGWLALFSHILIYHNINIYKLKTSQLIALSFYFCGTFLYITALYFLIEYLDLRHGDYDLQVASLVATFASFIVMIAVSVDVKAYLQSIIDRMGGCRPKVLKRTFYTPTMLGFANRRATGADEHGGGWDLDRQGTYKTFVILGEIEMSPKLNQKDSLDSNDYDTDRDDDEDFDRINRSIFDSFVTNCCQSTIEMLLLRKSANRYSHLASDDYTGSESGGSQYGSSSVTSYYSSSDSGLDK